MRNLFAAVAVVATLALGACANVNPVKSITELACTTGPSVQDVLIEQNKKYPTYNVHIENVVEGDIVATLIAKGDKADKIVVLGAVIDGQPSSGVVLLAVDGGCVVARKVGVPREVAVAQGLL